MKLLYNIPPNIKNEEFVYFVPFDLALEGQDTEGYIAVNKQDLVVFEAGKEKLRMSVKQIKDFKITGMSGCGEMAAQLEDDSVVMLAHFTLRHINRMGELVKHVNAYKKDGVFYETDDADDSICRRCGAMLSRGMSICTNCSKKTVMIKKLFKINGKKNNLWFLLSSIIFACMGVLTVIMPILNRILIDEYLRPGINDLGAIAWLCLAIFGIYALSQILRLFGLLTTNKAAFNLQANLRVRCMDKVHRLSMSSINKKTTGDLFTRITSSVSDVRQFMDRYLHSLLTQILTIIIALIVMLYTNWVLTLVVIAPVPFVFLITRIYRKVVHSRFSKQWRVSSYNNIVLNDIIKGIRVVKTFGKEKEEVARFDEQAAKLRDLSAQNERIWALIFPILLFAINFGELLIIYLGGINIIDGKMSLGQFTQFTMYLGFIYGPMMFWAQLPNAYSRFISNLSKILELVESPDFASRGGIKPSEVKGNVSFEGLTFGYKAYEPVLKNMSVDIKAGEMIGIVGPSGVGKSTMINLMLRLYEPNMGSIKIDGTDLKSYDIHALRDNIGIVFQDTFLFAGTIYENIAYAKENASIEEVMRAAKIANAHEFIINLPDGYETVIGENGHTLSGGERQRVSIARAILKDPKILLLDEATSSLDTETERNIQAALSKLVKGRTTIAIAHRLATLQNADRLIVLDGGEIKEVGSHAELLKQKGIYYNLVMAQKTTTKLSNDTAAEQV